MPPKPFATGPGPREQRSLFGEILDWMLAPLLMLWPMSVALTWLVAENIANRPFDHALRETARALAHHIASSEGAMGQLPGVLSEFLRADNVDTVYFQVLGTRGEYVSGDRELPVPDDGPARPGEVLLRNDETHHEPVRVAYVWVQLASAPDDGPALVQVAETLNKRSQLATEIIKGVILPQFLILPVAVLLVWLALSRGIAPLSELQQRIRRRRSDDLSPIDEREAPEEVAPLVRSINDLLARLDQSLQTQKHFLADAAHQLKTPLAGLRMQAELAQREIDAGQRDPQELKKSLRQIARSSQRAAHMVNQLLSLARAENQGQLAHRHEVPLARIAMDAVHEFFPRAMEKRIDLGYEGPDPEQADARGPRVLGNPLLVKELVRNLVDNAILYTPEGGTVTVRTYNDPFGQVSVLQVEDTGPGIPEAEREKVFQPFYRALGTDVDGSGLGLAIVREIAQQHEAVVVIDDARPAVDGQSRGTRVTVRFPAEAAAAEAAHAPGA
ncbi:sensor histidine kinase [Caldimonas thermodepolymerans]|uniref:histidine kinase n=1 Tax=Caldimonas thermodepolymerans TaxID=215580 RepID=A0AA46DBX9_9BURK|nr:sensor histidine kinase [Caldimonas thermodepolymerans]TCP05881.1 two-component system sensor histidine kinase TctE [Caldimonas thermodepolymerans]UZG48181.1 sensor histidine kinase N-terminal domain-containing protein [Caldimonas thermodepolymerans]